MKSVDDKTGTLYKCSPVVSILYNGAAWGGAAFGLVLGAVTAVQALHHVKGAAAVAGVFVAGAVVFGLPIKYVFATTRSVVVDAAGVTALAFGRPWRTLRWGEIQRIERIRVYSSRSESIGYSIHVAGDGVDIWMQSSSIGGFEALLADLTRRAQEHQIELWTRDRGPDTYRKIKTEIADPQARKRLVKSGIVTKVSSLVL